MTIKIEEPISDSDLKQFLKELKELNAKQQSLLSLLIASAGRRDTEKAGI